MSIRYLSTLLAVILLWQVPMQAQNNRITQFTLGQAQAYAMENSLQTKNATIDIRNAKQQVRETTAMGLPQVNADASFTRFINIPIQVIPTEIFGGPPGAITEAQFGTDFNVTANITASQLIFDGSYFVGVRAARAFVNLSRYQLNRSKSQIKNSVAKSYYYSLIAAENLKILNKNVAVIHKSHYEIGEMYSNGFVEKLDLDRLTLTLSNLKVQLHNAERQVQIAKNLLKFQMGMQLADSIVLLDSLQGLINNTPAGVSEKFNPENRIEFKLINTQYDLARFNMQRHKASAFPSLGAFYTHQQSAQRFEFNFFDFDERWYRADMLGLQLKVPIFSSFARSSRVQQAKLAMIKIDNERSNLTQGMTYEVQQARSSYLNGLEQLKTQKTNLTLAEEIYTTTQIKYNEGVGSSLEMTNAQSQLFTTQSQYIGALFNLLSARSDLEKALGMQ